MVTPDGGQLLLEDFGAAVGLVGVLGNDGCFGHHDARAGVFKVCVDRDLLSW